MILFISPPSDGSGNVSNDRDDLRSKIEEAKPTIG